MDRDFDKIIERKNTNSVKYDFAERFRKPADVLPLWVADMDFQAPAAVSRRLEEISRFGIYGYSDNRDSYFEAVTSWYETNFNWHTETRWIVRTPGVIFSIAAAIRTFTVPGDAVLIQEPVYYPFSSIITNNHRQKIVNPLLYKNGRYEIDFTDFEEKIRSNHVKLFLLCSPHNPVGRVWTKEELTTLGNICMKYQVLVVSDEIHSDFVHPGHRHTVFASISPEFAEHSMICTSPSKTFNLAGLQTSNSFIPNRGLRKQFLHEIFAAGFDEVNIFGLAGCETAYREGTPWLNELREYLLDNLAFVREYVAAYLPRVKLVEPEGTYLIWLDFHDTEPDDRKRVHAIEQIGKLWLDTGTMFGEGGSGFERINIACPRETLREAMLRLKTAYDYLLSSNSTE